MENQLVLDRIESLRGRRGYEEKKAAKLGFASLYDYFEDKTAKESEAVGVKKRFLSNQKNKQAVVAVKLKSIRFFI